MSQEIIASTPRGTLARPDDAWATGAGTTLAPYNGAPPRTSPVKLVHRLLRGRILLAIILAAAGLIAGAMYGWNSTTPRFTAEGYLEVKPYIVTANANEKTQGYFTNFVKSQPPKIVNARTISAAINREEWQRVSNAPATQSLVGQMLGNLNVDYIRDTFILRVSYSDEEPRIAQAAVDAVMKAYVDISKETVNQSKIDELRKFEDLYAKADNEFRRLQEQIRNLSADYGTDKLDNLLEVRQRAQQTAESAYADAQMQLDLATNNKTVEGKDMPSLTMEDMSAADPMMRYFLETRTKAMFKMVELSNYYGANSPKVQLAQKEYDTADRMANEYFEGNKTKFTDIQPDLDGRGQVVITPKLVEQLKQRVEVRRKRYEQEKQSTLDLAKRMTEIRAFRDELERAQEDRVRREEAKQNMEFQLAGSGQIAVTSEATWPSSPSKDRRKQFAAIGGMLGGMLPIVALLLIGLIDTRYKYSEEATETQMSGLTLLGILPNLPDRLSDPGQASIAAHCVHQVRTRLQIDAPVEGAVAYSVTSASSGDGKTSLTLALGLSFAASGSRTLLIDCDLVGAGLTARLNMSGPQGILDAITNRNLMNYVKKTDVTDLMMLPSGNAQLQHAGIFSPAVMKRLINEAKKHFEVILIDTGPVLGSIEATPVCSTTDGVILTVARGQQRPLVEKALSHLRSIGARISGVVFNRAQARDFEQSISGISLRSAARSQSNQGDGLNGHREGSQYGSLAKAVASSTVRSDLDS
ncbi:MAG TPA: AAA family ATPase [Tepidisphaeraceae bacterium]|nr:AAA family ATPase [Tepidisphaeraceae bacterium]